jgi:hypothetical protein
MAVRERLPERREHELLDFEHMGRLPDGRLTEVFLNLAKPGTAIENDAHDAAIVASITMQHGTPLDVIRHACTRNGDGSASGALVALLDLLIGPS